MRIIDISQELLGCEVYPGDPVPCGKRIKDMRSGEVYNLSELSMCAHNGTHIDAPAHFLREGDTVEKLDLAYFVGECYLARRDGILTACDANEIVKQAAISGAPERILIAGGATVTAEAAEAFRNAKILLLGSEGQSVGPADAPMEVHLILLGAGIVLLEGLRLGDLAEGKYFLSAAPLNISGFEGAPCRAYLIEN